MHVTGITVSKTLQRQNVWFGTDRNDSVRINLKRMETKFIRMNMGKEVCLPLDGTNSSVSLYDQSW